MDVCINRLIACLLACLLDWLIDWLIDWLTDWLIDWLINWILQLTATVKQVWISQSWLSHSSEVSWELNSFGNRTSPSDNLNDRCKRLVSWAVASCVWTLRALIRKIFLTYLLIRQQPDLDQAPICLVGGLRAMHCSGVVAYPFPFTSTAGLKKVGWLSKV